MSLLGFPLVRYIDIDDPEGVLRAIRDTPDEQPIEIILHTSGCCPSARDGSWTCDHPQQVDEPQQLGLPVSVGIGEEERELIMLDPPPRGRQPAVEYVPGVLERPTMPRRREMPRPAQAARK